MKLAMALSMYVEIFLLYILVRAWSSLWSALLMFATVMDEQHALD